MDPLTRRISAWDGLPINVREWPGDPAHPIVGLPGIVRTAGDFDDPAALAAGGRRMIAIDYAGRGASGRSRDPNRYGPEACVRDIMDVCAALHIHHATFIGTSFGGLLTMGLASARPGLVRAAVLNDIGPAVGTEGTDFVRDFIGRDPAFASQEECIALLQAKLPPLSLKTDDDWRRMADLTYQRGPDGRFHPVWDTRITEIMKGTIPDLWPLWGGLAHLPLLLIHGAVSNMLLPETVARMRKDRPDMGFVSIPGIGHAPTLTEAECLPAIRAFLHQHA